MRVMQISDILSTNTRFFMSKNIDHQSVIMEAAINQLLSGLPKTYIPFSDVEIGQDKHIGFGQLIEAVCEQDYDLNVKADVTVTRLGRQWLEIENRGEFYYFPNIEV